MDTKTIARDHESVRRALGDEPLNWLGQSGGTQLGAQYAELFPENIRSMILDCTFWPSQSGVANLMFSAISEEAALRSFFDWCEEQNTTMCPIAHQGQTVEAIWTNLLDRAEVDTVPASSCLNGTSACLIQNWTANNIRQATLQAFYKPFQKQNFNFAGLASAVYHAAFNNDASLFVVGLNGEARNDTDYNTSQAYAEYIITCNDRAQTDSATYWAMKDVATRSETPLMRGVSPELEFQTGCIGWPATINNPPHSFNSTSTSRLPRILMVSNLVDPATPYSMAMQLQEEIGEDKATLVMRNATGHTVYLTSAAFDGETVAAMVIVCNMFHLQDGHS